MKLRRWLRRLLLLGLALLVIVVIALLALPSVVSGAWGRERIAAILTDELGTPVQLGAVDFGWTSGLVVDGVVIGEDEATGLRVRRLTARPELLSLLSDEVSLRRIEIEGVDLVLIRDRAGRVRIEGWPEPTRDAEREPEAGTPTEVPRLSGSIALGDANVTFRDEATGATDRIEGIAVEVLFEPGADALPVTVTLPGLRFEGTVTVFEEGRLRAAPGVHGTLTVDALSLEAHAGLLPLVDGLDRLDGTLAGMITIDASSPERPKAAASIELRGAAAAGLALGDPVALDRVLRVDGSLGMAPGLVLAQELEVAYGDLRLRLAEGALEDGDRVDAKFSLRADAADVIRLRPGLLPAGAAGTVSLDAQVKGTLDALSATYALRAERLALAGQPDELARLPVDAEGQLRWTRADGRIEGESDLSRGGLRVTARGELRDGTPTVSATLAGALEERTLAAWIPDDALGRTGSGPVALSGRVSLRPSRGVLRLELAGDGDAGSLTLERGRRALTARGEASLDGGTFLARIETSLRDASGAPLLETVPELGSSWAASGILEGRTDGSELGSAELSLRLGAARLAVEELTLHDVASDERRGRLVARWSTPLGLLAPGRVPDLGISGDGEGRVEASLAGGRIGLRSSSEFSDLAVDLPGGARIREPSVAFATSVLLESDGRLTLERTTLSTSRLEAKLLARLQGVRGTPTGRVSLEASGELSALRPFLAALGDDAPEGRHALSVSATIAEDAVQGLAEITVSDLVVGERLSAGRLQARADGTWERHSGVVRIRSSRLEMDDTIAEGSGWLDLAISPPRFVGTATASGDLARIPGLPEALALAGRAQAELRMDEDGGGVAEARFQGLRVHDAAGALLAREEGLKVTAAFASGETLPTLEHAEVEAAWGSATIDGPVDLRGTSEAKVAFGLDLPAFVRAHPAWFPPRTKALGRASGELTFAGRLDAPREATGEGTATVERLTLPGYDVKDATLDLRLAAGVLELREGTASVNGGATTLAGRVDLTEEKPSFTGTFSTRDLRLAPAMEPIARYASPLFALASDLSGQATLRGEFRSTGLDPEAIVRGLGADLTLGISDGRVAGSPVIGRLLGLLRRGNGTPALDLGDFRAELRIRDGKLVTEDLRVNAGGLDIRLRGVTGLLDRSIDYAVRVKPPGKKGDLPPLLRALDPEGYIPFRLGGTLSAPALRPPDPEDVGKNLLEGVLKDLLKKKLGGK